MANTLKHDATVGRLLIIDKGNPPDLTAEEFLSYINEGFVPVSLTINDGTYSWSFKDMVYDASAETVTFDGITFSSEE